MAKELRVHSLIFSLPVLMLMDESEGTMDQQQISQMHFLQEINNDFWGEYNWSDDALAENSSMLVPTMPPSMTFTFHTLTIIIVYSICFLIAAVGNLTVFLTLSRGRYRKSRISLMICHLSIADLLVAFFTIPIEIGWRLTVQWIAGDLACRLFLFLRAFGLYLSNNILICVSLDRYFAVLYPLRVNDARRRGKIMLSVAWFFSVLYAVPQSIVFHVSTHPDHTNFTQCVTFGSFPSPVYENTYNVFCIVTMYFIPLFIIIWVYIKILWEISSKSRENRPVVVKSNSNGTVDSLNSNQKSNKMHLRRSDMTSIERARSRTLKMTIKIVVAFIFCWTPYITMNLWYVIDRESAKRVNELLQESLFIMAVGNSCANPLVYGAYAVDLKKECCRCFFPFSIRKPKTEVNLIHRSTGSKIPAPENKTSGVSKQIVHSFRQAVHGLFKVGSGQTKSTAVCGKLLVPPSPKFSISTTSKDVAVEKMPLHTMNPIIKNEQIKAPCSEPIMDLQQQSTQLNSPTIVSGIMEHQTA